MVAWRSLHEPSIEEDYGFELRVTPFGQQVKNSRRCASCSMPLSDEEHGKWCAVCVRREAEAQS